MCAQGWGWVVTPPDGCDGRVDLEHLCEGNRAFRVGYPFVLAVIKVGTDAVAIEAASKHNGLGVRGR